MIDGVLEEDEFATWDVICKTRDCGNNGVTLRVPASPVDPMVVCGACGHQITAMMKVNEGGRDGDHVMAVQ